jgi:hypothetical protein
MYSADVAVVLLVLKFEMSSDESERNCLVQSEIYSVEHWMFICITFVKYKSLKK